MSNYENSKKETFGQRLSRMRKNKNFTQEEIAEKVSISPQAVSKWENDITSPDIDTLILLSDILDVSLNELMGKEEKKPEVKMVEMDKKDLNKLMIKVSVIDKDEKVKVNLPVALIKVFLDAGKEVPLTIGGETAKKIDFEKIFQLIEEGVIGELVSIEGSDGERVTVTVE